MASYKVEYKQRHAGEAWATLSVGGNEASALQAASRKKSQGAFMVRVTDPRGNIVFSA